MINFKDYLGGSLLRSSMRLSREAYTTAGLWHENNSHKCSLYLADMPLGLHKHNIVNSLHLIELEELFEEVALKAYSADYDTMYSAALDVCPDLLLHHSDEYMAGLIHKLSVEEMHQNIFVVCGYG